MAQVGKWERLDWAGRAAGWGRPRTQAEPKAKGERGGGGGALMKGGSKVLLVPASPRGEVPISPTTVLQT